MISSVLDSAALVLLVCGAAAMISRRVKLHTAQGILATVNALLMIARIIDHSVGWALWNAWLCGWFTYLWWHGGGDGTRRRLRSLRRRFTGVRRTAPQPT